MHARSCSGAALDRNPDAAETVQTSTSTRRKAMYIGLGGLILLIIILVILF